jgi:glycosyltransferase involved in cell wall biosynthesis
MGKDPTISVITVVFNDRPHIEQTLLSVLNQTYAHIEYIVIDGASTDGTLEIVKGYGDRVRLSSEPDRGLYDAMNKGIRLATGEYLWFLNSGDRIYREDTVRELVEGLEEVPDLMYGGTMIIDEQGKEIGDRRLKAPANLSWKSFKRGMVVCHQSILARRSLVPEYNLEYRISADIDWTIRTAKNAGTIHNTRMVLSRFMEGGLSGKNIRLSLKERFRIMSIHYGFLPTLLRHFLFAFRLGYFYLLHRRI